MTDKIIDTKGRALTDNTCDRKISLDKVFVTRNHISHDYQRQESGDDLFLPKDVYDKRVKMILDNVAAMHNRKKELYEKILSGEMDD